MKSTNLLRLQFFRLTLLVLLFTSTFSSFAQSGIYGGGPVYKNRSYSINELKNSGFTHIVVWTIHIDASGNFNFNAEFPLVQNGSYIGGTSYPNFAGDIASLKTGNTSVNRIDFCISGWGSSTFSNIKNLIASQGTGSTSMLYKNFLALHNAFPAVDAIGFDDESTYDVNSSVSLAVMLGNLGFKVTLVPYTNSGYWTSVANNTNSQRAGTVDRVDLQCYSGGAGNNPCSWSFGSVPVFAGLWDAEKSVSQVQSQLTTWKNSCAIKGGFMWLYDDFDNSGTVAQYATAIKNVFGGGTVANRVVTVNKDCNYTGSLIGLPVGDYTLSALQARGVKNDDISSLKVTSGYKVQLYENDNYGGATITLTADNSCLVGNGWNDRVTSLKITSAGSVFTQRIEAESYSSMAGVATETCSEGGLNVGWIEANDWMAFPAVSIPAAGTYTIEYRIASLAGGGSLQFELAGGSPIYGTIAVPSTGGWQTWTTIKHTVSLSAGSQIFAVKALAGGWNFNWFAITQGVKSAQDNEGIIENKTISVYPSAATNFIAISGITENLAIEVYDITGKLQFKTAIDMENPQIDISNLNPAMYILIARSNNIQQTLKFIKN